jgi:hypothetical protein
MPISEAQRVHRAAAGPLRPAARDTEADESARSQRRSRNVELARRREQIACEAEKLSPAIEAEKGKLQKLNEKYQSVLLDPDKTDQAVRLRIEGDVLRERIGVLEKDRNQRQELIQGTDNERRSVEAAERTATENETITDRIVNDANRAADSIETIVESLQELRSICTGARYGLEGHSPANADRLLRLSEDIRKSFLERVIERVLYRRLQEWGLFLVKQEWP